MRAIAILLFIATSAQAQQVSTSNPVPIPRPSEPQATYLLLEARPDGTGAVVFVTKRIGPSGETFTTRRTNCRTGMVRTMGTGETYQAMLQSFPDPGEVPLVRTSSAYDGSRIACGMVGERL